MSVFFPKAHEFTMDMGYTQDEFKRSLPNALKGRAWAVNGNTIECEITDGKNLAIKLSEQKEATLGTAFTRRYMDVHFQFDADIDIEEVERFLRHFERFYQKGGG